MLVNAGTRRFTQVITMTSCDMSHDLVCTNHLKSVVLLIDYKDFFYFSLNKVIALPLYSRCLKDYLFVSLCELLIDSE